MRFGTSEFERTRPSVGSEVLRKGVMRVKVIAEPKQEEEILAAVSKNADAEKVREGMVSRAECCVVHLCGCK